MKMAAAKRVGIGFGRTDFTEQEIKIMLHDNPAKLMYLG